MKAKAARTIAILSITMMAVLGGAVLSAPAWAQEDEAPKKDSASDKKTEASDGSTAAFPTDAQGGQQPGPGETSPAAPGSSPTRAPGGADTSSPAPGKTPAPAPGNSVFAPGPGGPASPPAATKPPDPSILPEGPFTPERYYGLLLERQDLAISYNREVLKALAAHNWDPVAARKALKQIESEREKKKAFLFKRYHVTPDEYYRDQRGTDIAKDRSAYLDEHPDIRDRISANSKTLRQLEKEVGEKMVAAFGNQP